MTFPVLLPEDSVEEYIQKCVQRGIAASRAQKYYALESLWRNASKAQDADALRGVIQGVIIYLQDRV